MKKFLLIFLSVLFLASCNRPDGSIYRLVNGDKKIDWLEFLNDSTIKWVGPGPMLLESAYVMRDSIIIVETAPLSRGFLYIQEDGTLQGCAPFFEGVWEPARKPHENN